MRFAFILAAAAVLNAAPALATGRIVECTIIVRGHLYFNGPCPFIAAKDGSFSIGVGEKTNKYWATVDKNEDGTAEAHWNEDPFANHAQTPLGMVSQHGACWVNANTVLCAK